MDLQDFPLILALVGLVMYTVLGGADFGAGFWKLTAGGGEKGRQIREHAHNSMGPVWEANHVWLIFVLVVMWTAYPVAFGSIASTLSVPLFVAAVGIIFRGTTYALRSGASEPREMRVVDVLFSLSSILTPFAFGAAVGGIASGRVPVGNAAGDLVTSWANATSIMIGVVAVATGAYLAAVYLAADAERRGERDLERLFRARALFTGVITGAIALGGLAVLHSDAEPLYHDLVAGAGLPALGVSIVAGLSTLALVYMSRFETARYSAALAVAAIIAGWALAQQPTLLPGLTIREAAASDEVLIAVTVAVIAGSAILLPSLALLFRLYLGGRLDAGAAEAGRVEARGAVTASRPGLLTRSAGALLIPAIGFLTIAESGWAHVIGVVSVFAFMALGFVAVVLPELSEEHGGARRETGAQGNSGGGGGGTRHHRL
jgi:cytochrome bd ubiquinol oxidase subunit II